MTSETPTIVVEETRRSRSKSLKLFLRDIILIFVAALLISFLIKTFLIRSFYIPSESMMDTLHVNDRIIVNLLEPTFIPIERGDVVVFRDPGGWLTPQQRPDPNPVETFLGIIGLAAPDSEDHLIKRVIGLPGDVVKCCNDFGQLTINGIPIEEPYTRLNGANKATESDFEVTVPEGSLWVMGDNRFNSADSAFHHKTDPGREYVPIDNVVGRAVLLSWPIDRWTVLDNYPLVFRDVAVGAEDAEQ